MDSGAGGIHRPLSAEWAAELRRIVGQLDAMRAPNEPAFMAIGDALAQALALLNRLDDDFAGLAGRLDDADASNAIGALGQALERCRQLSGEVAGGLGLLVQLDATTADAERPLTVLAKIAGEIAALAINAKIQAAQVFAADTDFSVFTTEIARLGQAAGTAITKASDRLDALHSSIARAKKAEELFQATDAQELETVRTDLADCLETLVDRKRRAVATAGQISARAHRSAQRVAACIAELQINDLTSQRIEHIGQALGLLCGILDPAKASGTDWEWASQLDETHRMALVATVCRLQASQLDRAAKDFVGEVGKLRTNLLGLAGDAGEVVAEAMRALGGGDTDSSFVRTLEDHVDRACTLLRAYGVSEDSIRGLIETVSGGFAAMAEDLDAIHSIDADMRIMGLNASLKCGRLGQSGRALGVVAQELRACSRRTEETALNVSRTLNAAVGASDQLAQRCRADHEGAGALAAAMGSSVTALRSLGGELDGALDELRNKCGQASSLLTTTADGIGVDRALQNAAVKATASLSAMAQAVDVAPGLAATIQEDVRRLLEKHYTMASERIVHALFAEGDDETAPAKDGAADMAAVDDCFF